MLDKVRDFILERGLLRRGERVAAACSGGPDSMALLHLLLSLKEEFELSLLVAHFNHKLRGDEVREDLEFVRREAGRLGLPFHRGEGDTEAFCRERGISLEEGARELRYRFLFKALEEWKGSKIALGHTADDKVENFLMGMIRGAGKGGLSGMRHMREGVVIRPLLSISRKEVLEFLEERGIAYRVDSSNREMRFLRNRVRVELIPFIEREFNPSLKESLLRLQSILEMEDDLLEELAGSAMRSIMRRGLWGESIIERGRFEPLHPALKRRVLLNAFFSAGGKRVEFGHIERSLDAVEKRKRWRADVGGGVCFEMTPRHLFLYRAMKGEREAPLEPEGLLKWGRFIVETGKAEGGAMEPSPFTQVFDPGMLHGGLLVRSFRPGDRVGLPGGGRKKVHDIFVDRKVPRYMRRLLPIIEYNGEIVWIPGVGRSVLAGGAGGAGECLFIHVRAVEGDIEDLLSHIL